MCSYRFLVVLGWCVLVGAGLLDSLANAQGQAAPAMAASPPQQMPAYGVPATYPSTDPPAYPSTDQPTYPSTDPATTYPSTAALSMRSSALSPYDTAAAPVYAPYGSPDPMTPAASPDANRFIEQSLAGDDFWTWQLLPDGLMYRSYLAGNREPRLGSQFVHDRNQGWLWDATLGARVGLVRFGTEDPILPQGWQLDVEGAAFPRMSLDNDRDMVDCDFRAGIPLTTRQGPWEMKFGYYHYCSHIGDEYLLTHSGFIRDNYVRESLVLGLAAYLNPSLRLYGESSWAFYTDGQAKPWEFQFGIDFCSMEPTGGRGAPFFAINGHLHQETDFSGNLTIQTGWMWRGQSGRLVRIGMQYFNGLSDQAQFYNTFEEQIGAGIWYDF